MHYAGTMRSKDVVRIARERAGLTQQQLAARSGRPRETIARWESGAQEPSLKALDAIVDECGLELVLHLAKRDVSLQERTREQLELLPAGRLDRLLPRDVSKDVVRVLRWIAGSSTPSVVIGSVAAVLQGGAQRPEGSQVELVSADPVALDREMRKRALVPVDVDDRWSAADARAPWTLPKGGTLVLATNVAGARDYPDLRRNARTVDLDPKTHVQVAHPRDLLRMADASPRDAERARVPGLRALLEVTS